jgi:hypothetical protein
MDYEKLWNELKRHITVMSKKDCNCTICERNREIVTDMALLEKDITYFTRSIM